MAIVKSASQERARLAALVDRLSSDEKLPLSDRNAVCGQWRDISHLRSGAVMPAGDQVGFIVSGWACRLLRLPTKRRQIISFLVPGDVVRRSTMQDSAHAVEVVCLTPVDLVDVTVLLQGDPSGKQSFPALSRIAARLDTYAERFLLDHLIRLGARDARAGIADLLLEFERRVVAQGLGNCERFPMPIGQRPIGDAMGLSLVHVNRTLKQLRMEGLIDFGPGWVRIVQPEMFAALARGDVVQSRGAHAAAFKGPPHRAEALRQFA
jgi:CRP-like cAMP-binding protein